VSKHFPKNTSRTTKETTTIAFVVLFSNNHYPKKSDRWTTSAVRTVCPGCSWWNRYIISSSLHQTSCRPRKYKYYVVVIAAPLTTNWSNTLLYTHRHDRPGAPLKIIINWGVNWRPLTQAFSTIFLAFKLDLIRQISNRIQNQTSREENKQTNGFVVEEQKKKSNTMKNE